MNEQNGTLTHALVTGCPSTMGDDVPLNTTTLIRHAARTYADQEILYRNAAGGWDRYTYRDCYERVGRAAGGLRSLGVGPGDRVGVLDWNSRRYFELYYAIPGVGGRAPATEFTPLRGRADLHRQPQRGDPHLRG